MRAMFFSMGLFIALWGISFLFVDKIILKMEADPQRTHDFRGLLSIAADNQQMVDPPDWAAFGLISLGTVTMMYSIALPRRKAAAAEK